MKNQVLLPLAFALICSCSPVAAQGVAPAGSFGFLVNAAFNDPVDNSGGAILGVMNFDGAGNVAGTYTFQMGASGGPAQTLTGTFSGTYSSNPDGTGTISIALDIGVSFTFAMVITEGGQVLQLVATGSSFSLGGGSFGMQGSPQALAGQIPAAYVFGSGATGGIPISLVGAGAGPSTLFTPSGNDGTGSGVVICPDGSTQTWNASVNTLTMIFNPDLPDLASGGGGSLAGDVLLAVSGQACGSGNSQTLSGSVTGTVGPDGTVKVTIHGGGAVVSGVARVGQSAGLQGSFGFQTSSSPVPSSIVGVLTFDGAGNVTESATVAGPPGNAFTLPVSTGMYTGTYTVNADGTGSLNFTSAASGQAVNVTIAFVTTDGGNGILLLGTSTGSNVRYGFARMQ